MAEIAALVVSLIKVNRYHDLLLAGLILVACGRTAWWQAAGIGAMIAGFSGIVAALWSVTNG